MYSGASGKRDVVVHAKVYLPTKDAGQCFKYMLLISKQVKNLYKWTSIRWEMEYLQWMVNTHV